MKKIYLLLTVIAASVYQVQAQQDAMFSQYMFNMMMVNPAYTGSRDVVSLNALYRKQWVGIEGAPQTVTFSGDMPIAHEKMGVGLTVFNDRIGVVSNTGFYGTYAYRIQLTNNSTLAMGTNIGITNYTANLTSVEFANDGSTDNAFGANVNKILPNVGFGLYYSSDNYYIGLSMPHVLNNKFEQGANLTASQKRHAFLMAGYVFTLNDVFKLKPSFLIKQVSGAPIQMDLNANLWMYDKFGLGLSYRSLDAPIVMAEIQATDQLRIGYAFDYSTTRIKSGSHEFMLRYEFGYDKAKVLTPRYF